MATDSQNTSASEHPFRWAVLTDKGKVREQNEDTFFVDHELALFLISDGMGGHRGGALASKIVAEDLPVMIENGLNELRSSSPRAVRALFRKVIVRQSRELRMEGASESGYKDMGATLVAALLKHNRCFIANIGDSRGYLFRDGRLIQRTRDHSVISSLLREGKISPEESQNHAAYGQITHYIGMDEEATPYVRTFALKQNDRLLLCTDGLTDLVTDAKITEVLSNCPDPHTAARLLVQTANAAGGYDNITVIIIDWLKRSQ